MITADLHSHTRYSHGASTPQEMYAAACAAGLSLLGFTEHSPRPLGFDYTNEYREQLSRCMPTYAREVCELRDTAAPGACRVLFGMEMDWLEGQEDFARKACSAYDFDYLLGSVHFIGRWGFDDRASDWDALSQEECERNYVRYFQSWRQMIASGMFQIAAHPDLVKIFSVDRFHIWLNKPGSLELIRIYPCAPIMRLAAELRVPVTFASDAHITTDVAFAFPRLESYARAFGFTRSVWYRQGRQYELPL